MINTKKYIVLTMVAVLVFFTGCKDKNTQVSLTDKAENNSQTTRVEAGENSEEPSESLEEIYVYVSGQVNNPGVYCLKSNDRVFMAIEKAGGLTKKAQKQGVNMAEVLKDGQNIVVLSQKEYYAKLKENQNGSEKNLDGNSDSGNDGRIVARALMTRHMIVKTLRRIWLTLTLQMLRVLLRCQELETQELKQL